MQSILGNSRTRLALATFAILALGATIVAAGTTVTMTKTSSSYATTYFFDGETYLGATVQDLGDDGYYLSYYVYDYTTYTYVERGAGYIPEDDVTVSANGLVLDTDTSDIAVVGDGGTLALEWAAAPGGTTESDSKTKITTDTTQTIYFSGYVTTTSTVEGSFLGEDYVGTGSFRTTSGKQIIQVQD